MENVQFMVEVKVRRTCVPILFFGLLGRYYVIESPATPLLCVWVLSWESESVVHLCRGMSWYQTSPLTPLCYRKDGECPWIIRGDDAEIAKSRRTESLLWAGAIWRM